MSTLKKVLALTLALAMILSVSAFAGSYKADTYKDAASIDKDCEDSIELLYALDIMQGDAQGNFRPNDTITRAEVAKMIYVIKNYGNDDKAVTYQDAKLFSDVPATAWYAGYVNYCGVTKLIQGRGNGTFGPTDPVTTAAAAKMLLTAIGYDAEQRGYTGANWDKNVLSDAAIVGLLDDYKYTTIGNAPRQWVAVMFANALTNAYTYKTMAALPYNGLITSVNVGGKENNVVTFGEKYYDLKEFTGYLFATDGAYIDGGATAADGRLVFNDGDDELVVKSGALGYMDLGQEFRVIYKNNSNKTPYSIKATGKSVVADAELKDIKVANSQATSSNDANNKYIFTIGEMEAKFNTANINALTVADKNHVTTNDRKFNTAGKYTNGGLSVTELKAVAGDLKTDLYRAIDKDGDGDIDYMIIVEYFYAQVEKVAEHKSYGKYFTAVDANKKALSPAGFSNAAGKWYLDDTVNTDAEIEEGNVLKINYNVDNGKYDVEVLPVASDVTYEKRTTKGVHTLGGVEYEVAENGFEAKAAEKVLVSKNLKDNMDVAADGSLIVLVKPVDSDYDNLDDINAQLVMVTDAYRDVYTGADGSDRGIYYIDYMTIDGETHKKATLNQSKTGAVQYSALIGEEGYLANHKRLFVLRETGDEVYLIKMDTSADAKKALDYSSSLLDGYSEHEAQLDTEKNEFGADYVAAENSFFVSYLVTNSDGTKTEKFAVMSLNDMGEGVDAHAFMQGLYKTKRSYNNYLAGYIYLPNLVMNQDVGYLYSTSGVAYDIDDDEWYLTDVVFSDGAAEKDIQVSKVNGTAINENNPVKANCLYAYTYEKVNGEKVYSLTLINEKIDDQTAGNRCDFTYNDTSVNDPANKYEIINAYVADNGDKILVADHSIGRERLILASDCEVVLKKVVLDRDENQGQGNASDDLHFSVTEEISFVDFDVLAKEEDADSDLPFSIINNDPKADDPTYTYYSDYYYVGGTNNNGTVSGVKMLYVITYAVEIAAQH